MKKTFLLSITLLSGLLLTSCIKEEALDQECDIEGAWVEGDQYASIFYDPSQMKLNNISTAEKEINFSVKSLMLLPDRIPVFFTLSKGATIEPANGSEQDFTSGPVTYTVTSQDGAWKRQYSVAFKEATMPTYKYSFENYETVAGLNKNSYHEFYELDSEGNRVNIWASGNPGAIMTKTKSQPEEMPTFSTEDGYQGRGVCLNTQSAGPLGEWMHKPIAAGNLFMGRFIVENVLKDALQATQFGRPIDREPVRITGYYKYKPGPKFTNAEMKEVPGRVDEASIYAVFYRNKDENGNDIFLYGDNVLSSNYIVKKAIVTSLPATDEWTRFEAFFEGDDADPEVLAAQGYNMTLVFSSSKDGATFEGAIGSTLYIDEVEVIFEDDNDNE